LKGEAVARINTGKVFVGGLVSGIVLWLGDMAANNLLLKSDWEAFLKRMNVDMAAMETPGALAGWIASDVAFGVLMVWVYAAIRPRFGPGPKTALVAGMVMFVTMTIMMYGFMSMGVFSESYFIKTSLMYLVIMAVSAMAGAYFYKED
jgi:hypothetical protein